jgi:hypothetical protein
LDSAAFDDEAACDPDVAEDLGGRGEDVGEDNVAERDGGIQTRRDDASEGSVRGFVSDRKARRAVRHT